MKFLMWLLFPIGSVLIIITATVLMVLLAPFKMVWDIFKD